MSIIDRQTVFTTVSEILKNMLGDWEYSGTITGETFLVADLGFESLDIVIMGETIQQQYQKILPFAQFLAEVGQREVRDIRVNELVDFTLQHLSSTP